MPIIFGGNVKRKTIVSILAIAVIAFSFIAPTRVYAWPWSPVYDLKVSVTNKPRQGQFAINAVDCQSASINIQGTTYSAQIGNPWWSNNCTLKFNSIRVSQSGNYTVTLKLTVYRIPFTKTFQVYLTRPLTGTLSRSVTLYH